MMARIKHLSPLFGVLLVAALIRFVGLSSNPCGLFRDEADKGYTTYSLLQTGRDLGGRFWPPQIKSFGAYTSPFYQWFSLPSIATCGLTVFSTRLVAALAGTLACLAVYLVGVEWGGRRTGLFSALLLAVSPWHLLFSRWANQGILTTLFIPLAVWLTWKSVEAVRERDGDFPWWGIVGACIFWSLGWNAYAPARLFVPLFLLAILGIECFLGGGNRRRGSVVFCIGLGTAVLILPFAADILLHWEETQTRLRFLAGDGPLGPWSFAANYFSHWDPRYLLWRGDANLRHHYDALGQGQITWTEAAACIVGAYALIEGKGSWRGWLVAWLVLAPVPAAVTREGIPHALRTLFLVPGLALLGGTGLGFLWEGLSGKRRGWTGKGGILAVLALQTALSLHSFSYDYPGKSGLAWESGMVEAIGMVERVRDGEEPCTVSGIVEYPEAAVEFVVKPDPLAIQEGRGIPGYRFIETGRRFDASADDRAGLFLMRSWEIQVTPSWWRQIRPLSEEAKMWKHWRLYRSKGPPDGKNGANQK